MKIKNMIPLVLFFLFAADPGYSGNYSYKGQLSGWLTVNPENDWRTLPGLRYLPELTINQSVNRNYSLDSELSFNAYRSAVFGPSESFDSEGKIKPYRLWLRFSSTQFELRLGLQKINFGSASMLRPLMWFDSIDSRDPLQMTDGVYGFLFRYYFMNNANFWAWCLYNNDDTKGREIFETEKKKPEFGARFQHPMTRGEIAVTYHHRKATQSGLSFPEHRFAFDGKWDLGIGFWTECVFIYQDISSETIKYRKFMNAGLDYTFNIGNGLNAVYEYFNIGLSEKILDRGRDFSFSAFSASYPIGLLDMISGIVYYDSENSDYYRLVTFRRSYDSWNIYLIGFWNPDRNLLRQSDHVSNYFSGKGFQIVVSYDR